MYPAYSSEPLRVVLVDDPLLARVQSAELGAAQASVSTLEAEKKAASVNAERERRLAERQLTTAREAEVANVEAEKAELLLAAARQRRGEAAILQGSPLHQSD